MVFESGSCRDAMLVRLLEVIENDILPLTRSGVGSGNKIFGAAILRRSDVSVAVAATNYETANPLWHGEIHAINKFFELPSHPAPADCVFFRGSARPRSV